MSLSHIYVDPLAIHVKGIKESYENISSHSKDGSHVQNRSSSYVISHLSANPRFGHSKEQRLATKHSLHPPISSSKWYKECP